MAIHIQSAEADREDRVDVALALLQPHGPRGNHTVRVLVCREFCGRRNLLEVRQRNGQMEIHFFKAEAKELGFHVFVDGEPV